MRDTTRPFRKRNSFEIWWDRLTLTKKISVVWLTVVTLAVIMTGFAFPAFGTAMLIVSVVVGTIVAFVNMMF